MDELIFRALSGAASSFEEERLERWRREDPSHESRFRELSELWEATGLEDASEAEDAVLDLRAASVVAEAERRRAPGERAGEPPPFPHALPTPASQGAPRVPGHPRWSRYRWRGSAVLAAGLAALAFGLRSLADAPPSSETPPARSAASAELARTLDLPDGSVALLAPGARLETEMEGGIRRVTLRGRAFFAVVRDPRRPFLVRAGDSEVRVLGTRFEVGEGAEGVRTVVVEGRVRLASPRGEVEVPVGSVGVSGAAAPPSAQAVEDVLALLDWPGGVLVFRGTPLEEVAREVALHFGARIEVRGASLGARGIAAQFREESFAEVVETLCAVAGARCTLDGGSAVMAEGGRQRP